MPNLLWLPAGLERQLVPQVSETALREFADACERAAAQLSEYCGLPAPERSAPLISTPASAGFEQELLDSRPAWAGRACEAATASQERISGALRNRLEHCRGLARKCRDSALAVETAKLNINVVALLAYLTLGLALRVSWRAFQTGTSIHGWGLTEEPLRRIWTHLLADLLRACTVNGAFGFGLSTAIDWGIQKYQLWKGTRQHLDTTSLKSSALSGLLGGVIGGIPSPWKGLVTRWIWTSIASAAAEVADATVNEEGQRGQTALIGLLTGALGGPNGTFGRYAHLSAPNGTHASHWEIPTEGERRDFIPPNSPTVADHSRADSSPNHRVEVTENIGSENAHSEKLQPQPDTFKSIPRDVLDEVIAGRISELKHSELEAGLAPLVERKIGDFEWTFHSIPTDGPRRPQADTAWVYMDVAHKGEKAGYAVVQFGGDESERPWVRIVDSELDTRFRGHGFARSFAEKWPESLHHLGIDYVTLRAGGPFSHLPKNHFSEPPIGGVAWSSSVDLRDWSQLLNPHGPIIRHLATYRTVLGNNLRNPKETDANQIYLENKKNGFSRVNKMSVAERQDEINRIQYERKKLNTYINQNRDTLERQHAELDATIKWLFPCIEEVLANRSVNRPQLKRDVNSSYLARLHPYITPHPEDFTLLDRRPNYLTEKEQELWKHSRAYYQDIDLSIVDVLNDNLPELDPKLPPPPGLARFLTRLAPGPINPICSKFELEGLGKFIMRLSTWQGVRVFDDSTW